MHGNTIPCILGPNKIPQNSFLFPSLEASPESSLCLLFTTSLLCLILHFLPMFFLTFSPWSRLAFKSKVLHPSLVSIKKQLKLRNLAFMKFYFPLKISIINKIKSSLKYLNSKKQNQNFHKKFMYAYFNFLPVVLIDRSVATLLFSFIFWVS